MTSPSPLHLVRSTIATAAKEAGRSPDSVTLVAVTKTRGAEEILPLLAEGQRVFGENRVQEAAAKWPALRREAPNIQLQLIGPLQSNKVKEAVALFDLIASLDRESLARALAAEMARSGRRIPCAIQVNTGEEPQKAGIPPREADGFIAFCRDLGLPIGGLQCIPPMAEEASLHFALLRDIARRNRLDMLSMGMSADFPLAIRYGATHVRIGTALFGPRA